MKKWLIAFVALSCGLALVACREGVGLGTPTPTPTAAASVTLTAAYDGKTLRIAVGQAIVVTLDSNATTGYKWRLRQPLDEAVAKLEGSEYVPPTATPGLVGAGGQEVWQFTATGKGQTALAMEYVRTFEATPVPARTFSVTLVVGG